MPIRTSIELFAGCGGSSFGLREAGFQSQLCVEWDPDTCNALFANGFPAACDDLRDVHVDGREGPSSYVLEHRPDLAWFSPPCQSFSRAGQRQAALDSRNGFPWTFEMLDRLDIAGRRPKVVLIENVPGMLFHRRRSGCDQGKSPQSTCPRCTFDAPETFTYSDTEGVVRSSVLVELRRRFAHVTWRIVNCADFGVPQRRERVIIAAWDKGDYSFPVATHSREALVYAKWVSRDYWATVGLDGPGARRPSRDEARILRKLVPTPMRPAQKPPTLPWKTIRQTLDLEEGLAVYGGGSNPRAKNEDHIRTMRDLTDEPCTTIPALDSGSNALPFVGDASGAIQRRLTIGECALLQGFYKDFSEDLRGTKQSRFRQIGNAVPPMLSRVLALNVRHMP